MPEEDFPVRQDQGDGLEGDEEEQKDEEGDEEKGERSRESSKEAYHAGTTQDHGKERQRQQQQQPAVAASYAEAAAAASSSTTADPTGAPSTAAAVATPTTDDRSRYPWASAASGGGGEDGRRGDGRGGGGGGRIEGVPTKEEALALPDGDYLSGCRVMIVGFSAESLLPLSLLVRKGSGIRYGQKIESRCARAERMHLHRILKGLFVIVECSQ